MIMDRKACSLLHRTPLMRNVLEVNALCIQAYRPSSAEVHKKPGHDFQIEESEHDVRRTPFTSQ